MFFLFFGYIRKTVHPEYVTLHHQIVLMFFMYIAQLYFQEAERALLHCLL